MVDLAGIALAQFGDNIWGQFISLIMFLLFMFFYSRIMVTQIIFKLEKSAQHLEKLSDKGERQVLKKIKKRPDAKLRRRIRNFLEFFVIPPVSTDPFGVMKKLEHVIDLQKDRFKYFVGQVAPNHTTEDQANIMMGLSGAISLHQLAKIVRHFVELIKKTKSFNLAMLLQMQLPLIERMANALLYGTEALSNGWPIGDTIGPYVATNLIADSKYEEVDEDTIVSRKKYKGKDVIILKAKGPGGRTGNTGRVLEKITKKEKIAKIITIDAAAKLEGEKTGSIAEGVGVAMGGIGVEKSHIEEVAVKKKIPLDSIIIKMSQEEAIKPIKKSILNAVPGVMKTLDETLERTTEKGKIVIVGVGNTSGVGNNKKDLEDANKVIKKVNRMMRRREAKKKKRFKLKLPF